MTKYSMTDRCIEYSTAPAVSPFDFDIRYEARMSDLVYDLYCGTTWVASATTHHAADEVADEVIYRAFLSHTPDVVSDCVSYDIPDEPPPDDGPGQGGDIDGIPQGCTCCGASSAPILDGGRPMCVACHLRECPVCATLPRCTSCGDTLLEYGPVVCEGCTDAGYCTVCGADHTALHCPEVILMRQTIDDIAQLRASLLAAPYAALAQ